MESVLSILNIHKDYSTKAGILRVLKGISFDIFKGEIIAIVGPSGSGKSTLINMLAGIDIPTSGNIFYQGMDLAAFDEGKCAIYRQKVIGIVFQRFNLLTHVSTLFNIKLPRIISSIKDKSINFDALITLTDLSIKDKTDIPVDLLSNGQQQRVSVARAFVNIPEIILADEPTGSLDSQNADSVIDLFVKLNQVNGTTIVLVTHNLDILNKVNRVIYMRDGYIEKIEERNPFEKKDAPSSNGNIKIGSPKNIPLATMASIITKLTLANKKQLFFNIGVVIAGIATITALTLYIIPFKRTIYDSINTTQPENQLIISKEGENYYYNNMTSDYNANVYVGRGMNNATLSYVSSLPHVTSAFPVFSFKGTIFGSSLVSFYSQTYTPVKYFNQNPEKIEYGSYFSRDDQDAIILTKSVADRFRGSDDYASLIGRSYPFIFSASNDSASHVTIKKNLTIVGILQAHGLFNYPLLPSHFAGLNTSSTAYNNMKVMVDSLSSVGQVKRILMSQGYPTFSIEDFRKLEYPFVIVESIVLVILSILAFVSVFIGMVNILFVTLGGRIKEMLIFISIGLPLSGVRKYVFIEAVILGFFSSIIGGVIGYGVAYLINTIANRFFVYNMGIASYNLFEFPFQVYLLVILITTVIAPILAIYLAFTLSSKKTLINALLRE